MMRTPVLVLSLALLGCEARQSSDTETRTAENSEQTQVEAQQQASDDESQAPPNDVDVAPAVELSALDSLENQTIAGVSPGASQSDVRELLGEPTTAESDGVVMDATGEVSIDWTYEDRGLEITFFATPNGSHSSVAWVAATSAWEGAMPCGLRIGLPETDAIRVLGDDLMLQDEDRWSSLHATTEEGRVVSIALSQMGE